MGQVLPEVDSVKKAAGISQEGQGYQVLERRQKGKHLQGSVLSTIGYELKAPNFNMALNCGVSPFRVLISFLLTEQKTQSGVRFPFVLQRTVVSTTLDPAPWLFVWF